MSRRVAILGSTGSIGCNALEVIRHLGPPYRAVALGAKNQIQKLLEQTRQHRPACVAIGEAHREAGASFRELGAQVYVGTEGIVEMIRREDVDLVFSAIVGAAGVPAAFAAIESGKTLALANKESLVVAGALLVPEAKRRGVQILPVDSEHSAVFQAMHCGRLNEVRRVILTGSGGPFRNATREEMDRATPEDALNHPIWRMGNKITIDSATMFNKALEIIEACWLFDLPPEKIDVVIHPESVLHSMVEFVDGSVIAQLSPPDMRTPIQYALTYPQRFDGIGGRMEWSKSFDLHFEPPDFERFGALKLAYEVARMGGTAGAVMNAANEVAVNAFIAGKIRFGMILKIVALTIRRATVQATPTLVDLLEADRRARQAAETMVEEMRSESV